MNMTVRTTSLSLSVSPCQYCNCESACKTHAGHACCTVLCAEACVLLLLYPAPLPPPRHTHTRAHAHPPTRAAGPFAHIAKDEPGPEAQPDDVKETLAGDDARGRNSLVQALTAAFGGLWGLPPVAAPEGQGRLCPRQGCRPPGSTGAAEAAGSPLSCGLRSSAHTRRSCRHGPRLACVQEAGGSMLRWAEGTHLQGCVASGRTRWSPAAAEASCCTLVPGNTSTRTALSCRWGSKLSALPLLGLPTPRLGSAAPPAWAPLHDAGAPQTEAQQRRFSASSRAVLYEGVRGPPGGSLGRGPCQQAPNLTTAGL